LSLSEVTPEARVWNGFLATAGHIVKVVEPVLLFEREEFALRDKDTMILVRFHP
jgi:hypothetical protein